MTPTLLSEQKHIAVSFVVAYILSKASPHVFRAVFIRETERPGCRRRDGVSVVLLLNTRFKCLALLEVSHSVCSIIVKNKC